ncbi:hypothetical protein DSCO28_23770 [Desulfosarcina ovata subsp. sediminis]|uniref:Protein translocase subunit SecA n=1 Tax=Desulfosarcina ovata subsp. sediminis TaxID=885957 RepID=A0A5K7ZLI5_9BACT|nr:prepilin peptidase [Desulfosarcina ovata]BBO81811.1 hypothetical protein DSCO28_23770 [Desulfosarcina ovata subsp. sediminis]
MYNSSTAAGSLNMRPGLIAGCYPERGDDREGGWGDRAIDALQGRLMRMITDRQAGLRRIVGRIDGYGEPLADLDDIHLADRRTDLCHLLRTHGLSESLCLRAFALIREMAWRKLGKRHYDVQLMGGWAMLHGRLAEMETGEGKTLTATLAAATAALAGIPVHVLTVNEYLVRRDAVAMGPLYRALGLTVGTVTQVMEPEARREGYACDITYATNKQVAFDYLRDRLVRGNDRSQLLLQLEPAYTRNHRLGRLLLRGLCFAIVDEADSVLIDEARTPLILTRKSDCSDEHAAYRQAMKLAKQLQAPHDFLIDSVQGCIRLSRAGQQRLAELTHFVGGFWSNARRREELAAKALHALHFLKRDQDYLVSDDRVIIIDVHTGRTMPDRSWERGLHQLVEAKEGCPLTEAREPLGRLTYQRFFRRYLHLCGMTGTAREVADELWSIYQLRVQRIPLYRPSRRRALPARVFVGEQDKWAALTASLKSLQAKGQPVLIGTGSVAESEGLSRCLMTAGIAHRVLNARQDQAEAEIVAAAGCKGQVTVATNMAGRGTDIPLAKGVAELGGLHVIATCRNEARRIDRQLYGRCARQGDPGSYQVMLSLEDELVRQNCHPMLVAFLNRLLAGGGRFPNRLCLCFFRRIQQKIEHRHREARRTLWQQEQQTGRILAFCGNME